MGALHKAHGELIRVAREAAGKDGEVAVSIFVNPLQFEPVATTSDIRVRKRQTKNFVGRWCRSFVSAVSRGGLCNRPLDICGRDFVVEHAGRQIAPRTFPRGVHRGREAVQHSRARCGRVRRERFSTTGGHSTNGTRPQFQHRHHRGAYGPGRRRLACSSRNQYLNTEERKQAVVLYKALLAAKNAGKKSADDVVSLRRGLSMKRTWHESIT